MTPTQSFAIFLYSIGAVFAIAGPSIAAIRLARRYRRSKSYSGTYEDVEAAFSVSTVRGESLRDAVWGIVEGGFVALGVVCGAWASIILIV